MPEDEPRRILRTDSGQILDKPFFTAEDATGGIERPGEFPFTRGISGEMYRKELWHRDLYAGFGNVEDSRARYEQLLAQGASGINIALDLPTQLGLDSDDEEARGEVGKVGLAVDSLLDVEELLQDIDLATAQTIFTVGNGIGPIAAALFIVAAERQGCAETDFVLHLQNDPLKEFTGRGAFVFPIAASIRLSADVVEYAARRGLSHWKPIGICGSQYRWGGGSAIEEIAFGMAGAKVYINELLARGLAVDDFANLLEMHLAADIEVFEEVAKFRAARRLWAYMMRDEFGATSNEAQHLRISLYTAGYSLTKQEPLNNSVRITLQALAAVLGGVQHIGTLSIDEALSTPSADSARLAVRTQQILAYEAKLGDVADPLGGSHYVEWLTDRLAIQIAAELKKIDNMGGALAAIRSGYLQRTTQERAYRYQQEIELGDRTVVGVNAFVADDKSSTGGVDPFVVSDRSETRQTERLADLRRTRNGPVVSDALLSLEAAAREPTRNLMGPIKDAVASYATVGEICKTLGTVFGSWETEGALI